MATLNEQFIEKLQYLRQTTDHFVQEIHTLLSNRPSTQIISYFTTSFNISNEAEQESICLGSYHIKNVGSSAITNPTICILLPESSNISFAARYAQEQFKASFKKQNEWIRFAPNNHIVNNEYWLKPIGQTTLEPNHVLTFPNFQLKWLPHITCSETITATTYSDQFPDGIICINPIHISIIGG